MVSARLRFLREFVAAPGRVGAIAPSSNRLAMNMIEGFELRDANVVVELGPGTGALTKTIVDHIGESTRFVAIERSNEFATIVRERFPSVDVIEGCAGETHEHLLKLDIGAADYIVSGLPWAAFPADLQRSLLTAILKSLKPGGRFSTFAYWGPCYLRKGRRFRHALEQRFAEVNLTPIVWGNLPPAFAYQCAKT